jgi:RES domain-containing protein
MLARVDRRTVPMMDRRLLEFDVPDDAIRTPERYPDGPDQLPHAPGMRAVGDAGIKSAASLSLPVPGAIVHGESNVRINPTHPRFAEIRLSSNRALVLDSRLFDR